VVRSFLVKLAMLSATLFVVVWMGWPAPQDRGEAGLPGEATIDSDLHDASPSPVVARKGISKPSFPLPPPMSATPPTRPHKPDIVKTQLDVNQATVREFDQLPGIGPALAQRIIDYRLSRGRFTTVDDLLLIKGIGPKKFERFRELVTVHSETRRDGQRGPL
jgi:competence ComEA-like helix-hairpin-helix protein